MVNSKSTESKTVISKFISSKITDKKLRSLLWRKIVKINLTYRRKNRHFYKNPSSSEKDE